MFSKPRNLKNLLVPALTTILAIWLAVPLFAQPAAPAKAAAKEVVESPTPTPASDTAGKATPTPEADPPADGVAKPKGLLGDVELQVEDLSQGSETLRALETIFFDIGPVVDGSRINLAKLLFALLILWLGRWAARRARTLLHRRFHETSEYTIFLERLLGFVVFVLFVLLALDVAGIPLSAFAFLGGAVAIAIGFGAQDVLANFISGLILIFERPIRIGDLIELDGQRAKVADIGPRCTRLLQPGNVDLIVPNKKLLDEKLVNWTLGDPRVRTIVRVGVAYGSSPAQVRDLLLRVAGEHPKVEKDPPSMVIFEDFGDNALMFMLACTITIRDFGEQIVLQSELRFRIEEVFREAGIVISYPQRDVHLDAVAPIKVEVVKSEDA